MPALDESADDQLDEYCPAEKTMSGESKADHSHCQCCWDGDPCCRCRAPAMTVEEKLSQGMEVMTRSRAMYNIRLVVASWRRNVGNGRNSTLESLESALALDTDSDPPIRAGQCIHCDGHVMVREEPGCAIVFHELPVCIRYKTDDSSAHEYSEAHQAAERCIKEWQRVTGCDTPLDFVARKVKVKSKTACQAKVQDMNSGERACGITVNPCPIHLDIVLAARDVELKLDEIRKLAGDPGAQTWHEYELWKRILEQVGKTETELGAMALMALKTTEMTFPRDYQ